MYFSTIQRFRRINIIPPIATINSEAVAPPKNGARLFAV